MRRSVLAVALNFLAFSLGAQVRTFVSATGSDLNSCGRPDPCRNFAAAIAAVNAGGEVVALDSAGYGPFTVTKSVAVIAPSGVHAGVTATNGTEAITINAPNASVTLRNLYINTTASIQKGVVVVAARFVTLEGVTISNFAAAGLFDASATPVVVTDSVFRRNDYGIDAGSIGAPTGTPPPRTYVTVEHSRFLHNGFAGVSIFQGGSGVVRDSVATGGDYGFYVHSDSSLGTPGTASLTVERSTATNNSLFGFVAGGDAGTLFFEIDDSTAAENDVGIGQTFGQVRVMRSTVVRNVTGLFGVINSRGDNTLRDNNSNGSFIATFSSN